MSTGVGGWDKATCGEREVRKAGLWIHRRWEQWAGRIPQVSATELGMDWGWEGSEESIWWNGKKRRSVSNLPVFLAGVA